MKSCERFFYFHIDYQYSKTLSKLNNSELNEVKFLVTQRDALAVTTPKR